MCLVVGVEDDDAEAAVDDCLLDHRQLRVVAVELEPVGDERDSDRLGLVEIGFTQHPFRVGLRLLEVDQQNPEFTDSDPFEKACARGDRGTHARDQGRFAGARVT